MIKLTTMDDCPDVPCQFEIDSDCRFVRVISYCKYHQALKDTGLKDIQVWDEMRKHAGAREQARYAAKLSLELDKEHPGVPFKIEVDGSFTLGIDQKDNVMPEWEKSEKLMADIDEALDVYPSDKVKLYG